MRLPLAKATVRRLLILMVSLLDMLVNKFNCSRATLYRLFQTYGGVARYINQLRLQGCYKHLIYSNAKRSQITAIAQYWGFNNRQKFTRQFRQYFGVSPSNVVASGVDRLNHQSHRSDSNIDPNSRRIASWLKSLGSTVKG